MVSVIPCSFEVYRIIITKRLSAKQKQENTMKPIQNWLELTILLPPLTNPASALQWQDTVAEELVTLIGRGVEVTTDSLRIKAYLTEEEAETQLPLLQDLLQRLGAMGLQPQPQIQIREMEDKNWMEEWKKGFRPLRIANFLIKPSWIDTPCTQQDLIIEIDPGQAFGTGTHATTQLVLEALNELVCEISTRDKSLMDVGTGTGILAIGAARLGFSRILCIDNDSLAVEAAQENIQRNGVEDLVQVSGQDISTVVETFDVILANLDKNTLLALAEPIIKCLKPQAHLILSGILTDQKMEVETCFLSKGLALVRNIEEHSPSPEWVCLVMRKDS